MATNEILPFASTDTGTNLLTQSEYSSDSQRPIGNQPGIARSKLVNKALRQSSLMAAGIAEYLAVNQGTNVLDSLTPAQLADMFEAAVLAQLNGEVIPVDQGGTGATTASGARTNLSAQKLLVSGTNIKTLNGENVLGSGNLVLEGVPAGAVMYFASSTAPTGYLKANGATVSRSSFADLFSVIGTAFGSGDGSTTFGLPDFRGEFLRGFDDGRGVDNGRSFGSVQGGQLQAHKHDMRTTKMAQSANHDRSSRPAADSDSNFGFFGSSDGTLNFGGNETRPRNVALLACIKF